MDACSGACNHPPCTYAAPGNAFPLPCCFFTSSAAQRPNANERPAWRAGCVYSAAAGPRALQSDPTPLHTAVEARCSAAVELLLEAGADWDPMARDGPQPSTLGMLRSCALRVSAALRPVLTDAPPPGRRSPVCSVFFSCSGSEGKTSIFSASLARRTTPRPPTCSSRRGSQPRARYRRGSSPRECRRRRSMCAAICSFVRPATAA